MTESMTSKQQYYLEQFKRLNDGKISWNWSAFWSGGLWLYYRKTYIGITWEILVGFVFIRMPEIIFGKLPTNTLLFLLLVCMTIFGLFGNKWYYATIKRKIRDGYQGDKQFKTTSLWAVILSLIVSIFLSALEAKVMNFIYGLIEIVVSGIFAYILYAFEKRNMDKRATAKKNSSRQITEENIIKLV